MKLKHKVRQAWQIHSEINKHIATTNYIGRKNEKKKLLLNHWKEQNRKQATIIVVV